MLRHRFSYKQQFTAQYVTNVTCCLSGEISDSFLCYFPVRVCTVFVVCWIDVMLYCIHGEFPIIKFKTVLFFVAVVKRRKNCSKSFGQSELVGKYWQSFDIFRRKKNLLYQAKLISKTNTFLHFKTFKNCIFHDSNPSTLTLYPLFYLSFWLHSWEVCFQK